MRGSAVNLAQIVEVAQAAGRELLAVRDGGCAPESKADGSPVTEADRRAQELICSALERMDAAVPIVAEEHCRGHDSSPQGEFWLVDPLDGTKEFIGGSGEFTVNIALIRERVPVLGVVCAPALGMLYGADADGAWLEGDGGRRRLAVRPTPAEGETIVSSRSHGDADALARFTDGRRIAASVSAGSSLKFCLVAAGRADVYPRFGRTMEWDTAAGDAVLRCAGGSVTDLDGRPLLYGKPGFENPHFIAWGAGARG